MYLFLLLSQSLGESEAVSNTGLVLEKSTSPNGSIVNPPLFNFGNKVVPSTELTTTDAPSNHSTKLGPIFGLEKLHCQRNQVLIFHRLLLALTKMLTILHKILTNRIFNVNNSYTGIARNRYGGISRESIFQLHASKVSVPFAN
ncbi:hypothetical protein VNO77_20465 [Canavalia gladiata]|uniref:Uncharacterized protein n=1 Tax=Canavalia gladiata TaxID=3824 RepID=A0AAN9QLG3_CANGL